MLVAEILGVSLPHSESSPVISVRPEDIVVLAERNGVAVGSGRVSVRSAHGGKDDDPSSAMRSVEIPVVGRDGKISGVMCRSYPFGGCTALITGAEAQRIDSVDEITNVVVHDINNLLAVIDGGLRLLGRHGDAEARDAILGRLHHAIARGTMLSRRLLDARLSLRAAGGVSNGSLLAAAAETLAQALGEDTVLDVEIDTDLWEFSADPEELYFALLNLCRNADAATPEGGVIAMSAINVDPFEGAPEGVVSVTVADNGTGMPEQVLSHVFEAYFTTKAAGQGTGLGLAQVREFVERNGGVIRVESEVGLGTIVRMIFPRLSRGVQIAAPTDLR
jgi:signal transduction histidine kinase